jgi:hypothetical protein
MRRRDFVKAMMAASVSAKAMLGQQAATPPPHPTPQLVPPAPGPVPWMRGLAEVKPLPVTPLVPDAKAAEKRFFTDRQTATLRHLSEVLVPSSKGYPGSGYPGALAAGAPEFLDFLIGVSPADRKQMYQSGLDRLEAESMKRFKVSFASVDKAQADELLRPWLRTWMSDHPPSEPYAHFINIAHDDIRTATINSEAWSNAAKAAGRRDEGVGLYWYPVDPDLHRDSFMPGRRPVPNKPHS